MPIAEAPEAVAYLAARGIPVKAASEEDGSGWPAVGFYMRDEHGVFLAVRGRAISGTRKLTRSPTSSAVFVSADALSVATFTVTEGPMEALSLALCGLPALAMIGTNLPA